MVSDEEAESNFDLQVDPDYGYAEFEVYYDYED